MGNIIKADRGLVAMRASTFVQSIVGMHMDLPVFAMGKPVDDNHVLEYDVVIVGEDIAEETPILGLESLVVVEV